jgi:hypothetical protein
METQTRNEYATGTVSSVVPIRYRENEVLLINSYSFLFELL